MALGGLLYISIYVLQQLGVMLGVGSVTVLLCTHLVALHRGEVDSSGTSYAHAAHNALSFGFFLIILSGGGAVAYHYFARALGILLAPAFLFKWILVFVLLAVHLLQGRLHGWNNIVYGFAGGTWYALFLVHSLAPIASWATLGLLYVAWMIFFAVLWSLFSVLMQWKKKVPTAAPVVIKTVIKEVPKPVVPIPKPAPPPPPVPKPVPPPAPKPVPQPVVITLTQKTSWWKDLLSWLNPPAPAKSPMPPVTPKPKPAPPLSPVAPKPVPPPLPVVTLPKGGLTLQKPIPVPMVITPPPPPIPATKEAPKNPPIQKHEEFSTLPALRIMPQTPADIGRHDRPAVVKPAKQ